MCSKITKHTKIYFGIGRSIVKGIGRGKSVPFHLAKLLFFSFLRVPDSQKY